MKSVWSNPFRVSGEDSPETIQEGLKWLAFVTGRVVMLRYGVLLFGASPEGSAWAKVSSKRAM